jgi:hypothetical protein
MKPETAEMRILPIASLLLLALAAGRVSAQVELELSIGQEQFLRDEPVPVKVRITNLSGQTLHLGEGADWINFTVDVPGRGPVERVVTTVTPSPFDLESAHAATREFNLQPGFDIATPGRYTVSATLRIRQWDKDLSAKAKGFEVVRGAKLWEQEVGLPGNAGAPEVRRFILQQANYRRQLKLYARVSNDTDTYAHQVIPLGPLVAFGRPEAQVDEDSNLHVLFQTGPRAFQYSKLSPSGTLSLRQTYDAGEKRPTLRLSEAGRILVAHGIRRPTQDDIPPFSSSTNAAALLNARSNAVAPGQATPSTAPGSNPASIPGATPTTAPRKDAAPVAPAR